MTRTVAAVLMTLIALLPNSVMAGEVIVVKSKDSTSKDLPLSFVIEKTVWDG